MPDSISIGAAYRDQKIEGGAVDNTPIGATTPAAGAFTTLSASGATSVAALTATGNVALGDAAADTVGFYGATPSSQRAGAMQASSKVGTASSADVTTDLKAAVIELMETMKAVGLWKGSA